MKHNLLILIIMSMLLSVGCHQKKQENQITNNPSSKPDYEIWADTIIYEVLIQNPDTADEWETHKIKQLKRNKMVDDIFNSIYSGAKKAYNYYSNKEMEIGDIKNLEQDYKRTDVGKLQFSETWQYDKIKGTMQKKIHNILVAYTLYNSENKIRGYKAAFYIKNE